MTSRERVMAAISHEEPDRIPLDMGSNVQSGIMAHALDRLRKYLSLEARRVKVTEVFQMLGEVEQDVVERFRLDVLPVEPPTLFFDIRREGYKPWTLFDGTEVLVPGQFDVEVDTWGRWLLHTRGNIDLPVEAVMPKDGFYFDMPRMTEYHEDYSPPPLDKIAEEGLITNEQIEHLRARARRLRRTTDKALFLGCWGYTGLGSVGSVPDFLVLLMSDKEYVKELFRIRTENALVNYRKLHESLGDDIDIIGIDGTDYGAQNNELFPPDLFEELFLPGFSVLNAWIHENTTWKTWIHTCGSVTRILPHIVDGGFDVINPVQTSAAGMDARWLKETFGGKITFWGGGIDTQKTLPFSTPEEVVREVAENVTVFAPEGGFVFNTIHNVQHGTPPENIAAAYDAAYEYGHYPLKGSSE